MDPIGQSYLPDYFCPAALIDSRENHTRQGEGGAETTQRDYCSLDQTEMDRNKRVTGHSNTDTKTVISKTVY